MHEAAVFVFRSIKIKGVKQRPDMLMPWMFPGGAFYPFVYIKLVIQFLAH